MGKKCLKFTLFLTLGIIFSISVQAQNAGDVLRYSQQYPSYDPVSIVMPGVSNATGFGAFQENPAVMALFDESFGSLGLSNRYVNEDGRYLENTVGFDDNEAGVGDVGFVYNIPTTQGRLTIGGGYSQSHDFNRALAGSAVNDVSTITDFYASSLATDFLYDAAFDGFAIDGTATIFDFEENQFSEIDQRFEITERGKMGEYSAFIATEFFKNFLVGASIGVINGTYEYRRDFLEVDSQGNYEGSVLDTNDDGNGNTNIDEILSEDFIDATFSGFSARLGVVYKASSNFNLGLSYQFKNTLNVEDNFDTFITTTMDNGDFFEGEDTGGVSEYKITRPSRLNLGFTTKDLSGLTISVSAERVDYSEGLIEFEGDIDPTLENDINNTVRSESEDVYNLRFGLEYAMSEQFTPRIGYGYYPSPTGDFENRSGNRDRQFYSAGFSAQVTENTDFNLGVQLSQWDDQNELYTTPDVTEVIDEEVNRLSVMAGVTFGF
jgi:opacity protein-like surface antigen